MYSIDLSIFSRLSSSSTTRRKKKLVRKTQETREGSVYENIALMRQLHIIASEIHGYSNTVRATCLNLMELDARALDVAVLLHSSYADIITAIEYSINVIWPEDFINPPKPLNVTSAVLRLNIEHLGNWHVCNHLLRLLSNLELSGIWIFKTLLSLNWSSNPDQIVRHFMNN